MTLRVVPVGVRAARRIVEAMHAHHHAPPGALFCVGVADDDRLACVAIVSRPVARMLDASPVVAEVTRCASDRTPHAASMAIAAARGPNAAAEQKRQFDGALADLVGIVRKAFGLAPLDPLTGDGVTDAECVAVLTEYLNFAEELAETSRPLA